MMRSKALMKLSRHPVLLCGILSPVLALILYSVVYRTLTHFSADLEKDWLFRLSLSTIAMTIPFLATTALALRASNKTLTAIYLRQLRAMAGESCTRISRPLETQPEGKLQLSWVECSTSLAEVLI